MAKQSLKAIPRKMPQIKLSYRSAYHESLKQVLEYSVKMFGKQVATEFYKEIRQNILRLRAMPNMYPKCRFIDSTETKIYRNIVVRSYFIVYSVVSHNITIIDIIHQSVSPDNIKSRIE
jgi:plasmid stabilization system protein ParE